LPARSQFGDQRDENASHVTIVPLARNDIVAANL